MAPPHLPTIAPFGVVDSLMFMIEGSALRCYHSALNDCSYVIQSLLFSSEDTSDISSYQIVMESLDAVKLFFVV